MTTCRPTTLIGACNTCGKYPGRRRLPAHAMEESGIDRYLVLTTKTVVYCGTKECCPGCKEARKSAEA